LDVAPGDRFLLSSDGLHDYFEPPDGELEQLALELSQSSEEKVAERLIRVANERGGKDNITVIVLTFGGMDARDDARMERLRLKREVLSQMPLFRPLGDPELRRVLQVTEVRAFTDGQAIITQGEKGNELFLVLNGEAEVIRGGNRVVVLRRGEHFGEMALIRSQPRSATVRSLGESELMVINRSDFFDILRKEHQLAVKLLWQFTGVLADRLAETTNDLSSAKEELAEEVSLDDDVDDDEEIFTEEDYDRKTVQLPAFSSRPDEDD
jgi:CRP-like cAMP-binding protein